ncbi:Putative uncharacterized protein OS=Magnetospirillum magneticum (strain AMB-1 / ATCC 700264) GN=amb0352 PE=4 SV=1: AAA_24 [Tuwongella immobilis]|uniref:Uncharacterized protein n=1 Tax=Tuwongella immobilis TaxID=692036 RepID=A0A6C2YLP1_9BACT|nr:Putative uncharacterized protein OS=Magnetospirillum magneticum (strain AMB-1 / ATCC 700264) GN=amb0352 PE=4 SV=1: AAA_24 [Tuwongella immobilis]VTS00534.1 Putative uncharacterized protein OS=Magnetospirillum magneticum (strain AMB-1 / ATCC 700264) GN=amb0352 PE=4 SV=1: AAA_24 [Tuwongella immobilis]
MSVLSKVRTAAPALPSRVFIHAPEKWGKSSVACYAPKPVFILTEGETGLLSLIESGQVPETSYLPEARSFDDLTAYCNAILYDDHDYRSLVIDTSNGAERLLGQKVLDEEFNGVMMGKDGFTSYGKGDLACVSHWTRFLRLLDEIRTSRKMMVILLAHTKVKTVNNPTGPDYDQLRPDGVEKLWSLTHKWADIIAAGVHDLTVKDDKVKDSKGRYLVCAGTASIVAGNRYGLPDRISCGKSAEAGWQNFASAVRAAKSRGQRQPIPEPAKRVDSEPQPAPTLPPTPPTPVLTPETAPPPPPTTVADLPTNTVGKLSTRAIELMHKLKLSWTEARQQYSPLIGMPEGEVYKLTDLTPSQLEHLIEMLEESQK